METLALGIMGFVIFYTYDINSIVWRNKLINKSFFIGFIFVFFGTLLVIVGNLNDVNHNAYVLGLGIFFNIVFGALLIHALFFALPFEKTYVNNQNGRTVYDRGQYALCRHPGFIWFSLFYIALYMIIPNQALYTLASVLIALNLFYIILQDLWIFPVIFGDYIAYKRKTPFLIPTAQSIKRCFRTLGGNSHESEK